jgi:hypothetical protein
MQNAKAWLEVEWDSVKDATLRKSSSGVNKSNTKEKENSFYVGANSSDTIE